MKIATWNVNSIRARNERLLAWMDRERPDVVCLQETKVADDAFPVEDYRARGYHVTLLGQRTYNGVAILSIAPPVEVRHGLGDEIEDPQARLVSATCDGGRVASVYAPNGQVVGSEKWEYKLRWLDRLRRHLDTLCDPTAPLVLGGDFNVAPDERDVHDPVLWAKETLFHPDARAALARVTDWGLRDAYRLHHEEAGRYTWWDYRQLGFPKNRGLRIDHIFLTAPLAERCRSAEIDREMRKGKQPSDHAPMVVTLDG